MSLAGKARSEPSAEMPKDSRRSMACVRKMFACGVHQSNSRCIPMGFVYIFIFPNGKCYIGITTKADVRKRWHLHRVRKNKSWAVARAIRKYGWKSIKRVVLEVVPNSELLAREQHFVKLHNSQKPHGYNLTPGGDVNPMDDPAVCARHLERMRSAVHRLKQRRATLKWRKDDVKRENWRRANAKSVRRPERRLSASKTTTANWKDPSVKKNRSRGLKKRYEDAEYKADVQSKQQAGMRSEAAKAKKTATMLRKREELLAKLPPEKREAKRRDLEKRAAKARAKYVPRGVGTGSSASSLRTTSTFWLDNQRGIEASLWRHLRMDYGEWRAVPGIDQQFVLVSSNGWVRNQRTFLDGRSEDTHHRPAHGSGLCK